MKILQNFVAFSEYMNFNSPHYPVHIWINLEILSTFMVFLENLNCKTYDFASFPSKYLVKSEKVLKNIQNIFDPIVEVDGVVMSKNGTDESDHALK